MKTITDQALALAIPTAFPELFPDVWGHDEIWNGTQEKMQCNKCLVELSYSGLNRDQPCTVPTPIVIDWNVAMKVVRECDEYKVIQALRKIQDSGGLRQKGFRYWLVLHATPADYLRAALLAKGVE